MKISKTQIKTAAVNGLIAAGAVGLVIYVVKMAAENKTTAPIGAPLNKVVSATIGNR